MLQHMLVSSSRPGDLTFDPFAGSGTTAIADENTNRRWICIERDERYAVKAIKRISDHVDTLTSNVIPFPQRTALSSEAQNALLWFAVAV